MKLRFHITHNFNHIRQTEIDNTLMIEIHQINALFTFHLLILANLPTEKNDLVGFTSSYYSYR